MIRLRQSKKIDMCQLAVSSDSFKTNIDIETIATGVFLFQDIKKYLFFQTSFLFLLILFSILHFLS